MLILWTFHLFEILFQTLRPQDTSIFLFHHEKQICYQHHHSSEQCFFQYPLFSVLFSLSSLSSVLCPVSFVQCPLSSVLCPMSFVQCPLSEVNCRIVFHILNFLLQPCCVTMKVKYLKKICIFNGL